MPTDKCNSITAGKMSLIFHYLTLFNSAQQYVQFMHHGLTFVPFASHFSLLIAQGVDWWYVFPIHLDFP